MPCFIVTLAMGVVVLFFSFLETLKSLEKVFLSPALTDTSLPLCIGIRESFVLGKGWTVSSLHHGDLSGSGRL